MTRITWSDRLCTGIESIDTQHRRIVDIINTLQDRLEHGELALANDVLRELIEYKIYHCAHEEGLLKQTGFPFYKPHKQAHDTFLKQCVAYHHRAEQGEFVTREALPFLKSWMLKHIKGEDADYAAYIRQSLTDGVQNEAAVLPWHLRTLNRFFPGQGK